MTTDTKPKHLAVEIEVGGKTVTIGACCKGSGMIHPNMATMLGFITTDLNISKELLNKALKSVIPDTFNMISVDRDTSTNDTVLLLANGLAGNDEITEENEDYQIFKEALYYVNEYLAKCIAGDGEGATKLLEVNVKGAKDVKQAKVVAKVYVHHHLLKQLFMVMMQTGVDFYVRWDILVKNLILIKLIYLLKVNLEIYNLLKMEWLLIIAKNLLQKSYQVNMLKQTLI